MTAQGPLVLVVEDEPPMRRFLRAALGAHDYRLIEAGTVAEAELLASTHNPDLMLLDLGLPDGDGIVLTRKLREWTQVPIVVLSARGQESDKVAALEAGADDYLTKPFGTGELIARMRFALRHAQRTPGSPAKQVIELGDLHIDLAAHEVKRGARVVHLTPTEYKLLVLLAENVGRVLTHRQILKDVWGPAYATRPHYVRVHMAELRKKIEEDPGRPKLVVTELGVGYRLREPS